jgi:hypothetical protein
VLRALDTLKPTLTYVGWQNCQKDAAEVENYYIKYPDLVHGRLEAMRRKQSGHGAATQQQQPRRKRCTPASNNELQIVGSRTREERDAELRANAVDIDAAPSAKRIKSELPSAASRAQGSGTSGMVASSTPGQRMGTAVSVRVCVIQVYPKYPVSKVSQGVKYPKYPKVPCAARTVTASISGSFDSGHAAFTVRTSLLCACAAAREGMAHAPRHTTALGQVEVVLSWSRSISTWWAGGIWRASADSGAGQSERYFFVPDARHDPTSYAKNVAPLAAFYPSLLRV